MGRHFEVRAASMAASAKKKSAIYQRASKEIYMAAKNGTPDPASNLALRSVIDKYRKTCPKDVIERAINKAKGGSAEVYIQGRYEAFGPGGSLVIVDTLSDNVNRALTDVRTAINKKGGRLGSVSFNFVEYGIITLKGHTPDEIEEILILGDVDVQQVKQEDEYIDAYVSPTSLAHAKDVLLNSGISEIEESEIAMIPNEYITMDTTSEEYTKFIELLDMLDEVEDVQKVHHNVELN